MLNLCHNLCSNCMTSLVTQQVPLSCTQSSGNSFSEFTQAGLYWSVSYHMFLYTTTCKCLQQMRMMMLRGCKTITDRVRLLNLRCCMHMTLLAVFQAAVHVW